MGLDYKQSMRRQHEKALRLADAKLHTTENGTHYVEDSLQEGTRQGNRGVASNERCPDRPRSRRRPDLMQDRFWHLWNPEDIESIRGNTLLRDLAIERTRKTAMDTQ